MSRLLTLLFFAIALPLWAGDDHDHENTPTKPARPAVGRPTQSASEGCTASPAKLAQFANGEKYDFSSVVSLITHPACAVVHAQVSKAAMDEGIKWNTSGPYRLDNHARSVTTGPSGTASNVDQILGKTIPGVLREHPQSTAELLPLLGQLALLSPSAARVTLSTVIRQETETGEQKIESAQEGLKPTLATDLAVSLLRMGVLDPVVSSDLAGAVEEMALTVQADSLGKFFKGLAAAATADATLAPTFNLTAGALNRGVKRGGKVQNDDQKARLLEAVFESVRAAVAGSGLLEPGSSELNEAVGTLVQGKSITLTSLRKLWKEAVKLLAQSPSQPALAQAVAASLTDQMVFLKDDLKTPLMAAAGNYPVLAKAVQQSFVFAWVKAWNSMAESGLAVSTFNRLKVGYFEPLVAKILEFPPAALDTRFLAALQEWSLLKDDDIEKRFPRLFLSQLERRDKAVAENAKENSPENAMRSLATDMAVVSSLFQVHLPVLNRWVKKHEE